MHDLLSLWDPNQRFFKVGNMQKLLGKLARLGKGAPWIFKLMSHLYTSFVFALKSNAKLLKKSSPRFRELVMQILTKNYSGNISDHQLYVNFAMKKSANMINKDGHLYLVNRQTMQDVLNLISHALSPDSEIQFKTPIAHLILRIPTASIVGDSSITACGGYSVTLKFWWHLSFPEIIVVKTLLHLKDNSNKSFISINCLEYVTIILNYCASIILFATNKLNDNPHPVVLCMTDNTTALNWIYTQAKSQ